MITFLIQVFFSHSCLMHRILSPLKQLREEGTGHLPTELGVVGRDKSFQCLLMEEKAKMLRERAGGLAFEEPASPAAAGSPPGSPRVRTVSPLSVMARSLTPPKQTSEIGIQAEPTHSDVTCMTNICMKMSNTRDAIIVKQKSEIARLQLEAAKLQTILDGSALDVIGYFRPSQRKWLLQQQEMEEEEKRQQAVYDAASLINNQQFLREQQKVERRARKRHQRYQVVQDRIGNIRTYLTKEDILAQSPFGSPRVRKGVSFPSSPTF